MSFQVGGFKIALQNFRVKMVDILNDLGLSKEIMEQYPFELSGGMLQRCMIACALYVEPDLLIADEPTSALDTILQKEFIELLKDLNEKRGTTILLITHDLDIVVEVADEMIVMHKGKVVETGTVQKVFERPKMHIQNDYWKVDSERSEGRCHAKGRKCFKNVSRWRQCETGSTGH